VLDWGGTGPPLVFLAGFGNTAHVFDGFAPRFTGKHHVYGITRRGFGRSTAPAPTPENYDPDRLGDDVVAVLAALRLERPVLVGHSIAGQELSSIGSRHPEKVAGLIYLDAAAHYAFYDPRSAVLYPNAAAMRRDLERLPQAEPTEARALLADMMKLLPRVELGLDWYRQALEGETDQPPSLRRSPQRLIQNAMVASERMYTKIKAPVLSIVALPPKCEPNCQTPRAKARASADAAQAEAFQAANPSARIVRIPYADHFVFRSDPARVEREMNTFLDEIQARAP
jgi:pimeloyl-ACP methyl ester carboxylesterase